VVEFAAPLVHSGRRRPLPDTLSRAEDKDMQTAIRLAKRMIVDGRMPTPEEAERQLRERLERDRLGEPWVMLEDKDKPLQIGRNDHAKAKATD
jgi:hypothetical protein